MLIEFLIEEPGKEVGCFAACPFGESHEAGIIRPVAALYCSADALGNFDVFVDLHGYLVRVDRSVQYTMLAC